MGAPGAASEPSLLPREHGVYAELAFPLLTAFALGVPTVEGGLLALATVCAFLLHEPLLVLIGRRGERARAALGARARTRASVLVALGGGAVAAAAWLGGPVVQLAAGAAVPVMFAMGWLIATRREKTWAGEMFVAIVLPLAAIPVALACGIAPAAAGVSAAIWAAAFVLGTGTVHAMLTRAKQGDSGPARATVALGAGLLIAGITLAAILPARWPLAVVPPAGVSLAVLVARTSPRRLKLVGWSLVAGNVATLLLLLT